LNTIDLSAMQKALSLVRAGRLYDATACIQSSLNPSQGKFLEVAPGHERPPVPHGEVQDLVFKPTAPTDLRNVQSQSAGSNRTRDGLLPEIEANRVIESALVTKAGHLAYRLYVPERSTAEGRAPLVVMLHGCQQNSRDFAAGTQMDSVAGKEGCFVLYPQQSSRANPAACWNWFKHSHQGRERGEPQALVELISHLQGAHEIDASRIYVAGLSAGAAMAAILGEQYPEVFAAVGVHSGLPTGMATNLPDALQSMQGHRNPASTKTPVLPTIVFHGDADSTVSPVNGVHFSDAMSRGPETSVEELDGMAGRPFTRKIYHSKEGLLIGEYWSINGAGHAWSGGSASGSYADPIGPDASAEMMRFFRESTVSRKLK
jgi:poly(hydroxyalkanoate) depolymerase family esterase